MARYRYGSTVTDRMILAEYRKLRAGARVAKKLRIGEVTVYRVLKRHAVDRDGKKFARRFSVSRTKLIIKRYANGASAQSLARANGCSVWTIHEMLNRSGVGIRKLARMSIAQINRAKKIYISGRTFKYVAQKLGFSQNTIIRAISSHYPEVVRSKLRGPSNPHWQGGRFLKDGYWYVWVSPDDPMFEVAHARGYALEHRLVMSRKLGRVLVSTETVHHIDGDKKNNEPDNLELRQGKHGKNVVMRCLDCGSRNIGHVRLG